MRTKKISKQKSKVRVKKSTNLLHTELSNQSESSEMNLNSEKTFYSEKESKDTLNKKKELVRVMDVIYQSIKDLEIDITRAVKILKELTKVERSDIQSSDVQSSELQSSDVQSIESNDLSKDLDDGPNDLEIDIKDDKSKIEEPNRTNTNADNNTQEVDINMDTEYNTQEVDININSKAMSTEVVDTNMNKDNYTQNLSTNDMNINEINIKDESTNDMNIKDESAQNDTVTFSGDSYSVNNLIDKLKYKYKGSFSASMARSGMFTSKKRPNKEDWTNFLDSLVDRNILNKLPEGKNKGPVRYKF